MTASRRCLAELQEKEKTHKITVLSITRGVKKLVNLPVSEANRIEKWKIYSM
jgi:hypothetical protein